jgi:Zn-dependent M28 family amino/carboxypeptidase
LQSSTLRRNPLLASVCAIILVLSCGMTSLAQTAGQSSVCKECLQKDVTYLASDELRGRGSATADELTAANYIAGVFKKLGLETSEAGDYILPVDLGRAKLPTVKSSKPTERPNRQSHNVVGILRGSDPKLKNEYIMFSAHMDHLGVCAKKGDMICNGANDDASGTATVLELARIFTSGPRPKRSIAFTTYGSEELGLLGSRAFATEPPIPLADIAADIEFEQTGFPESKVRSKTFWMTGSSFSDLGALLRQHGSQLADDPYSGSPFFSQSDNYSLATKGVVAHTISGAAEFPDYHKPGDEVQKLNFDFLASSLQSVLPGFEWLVNTDTRPKYLPGKNPAKR